jgi:hypothetical protein
LKEEPLEAIDLVVWSCPLHLFDANLPEHLSSCALDEYGRFRINHPFDWSKERALLALGGYNGHCTCLHTLAWYRRSPDGLAALRYRRRLSPLPDHPWPQEDRPAASRPFLLELAGRVVEVLRKRGWDAELTVDNPKRPPTPLTASSSEVGIYAIVGTGEWGANLVGGGSESVRAAGYVSWGLNMAPDHLRLVNGVAAFYEHYFLDALSIDRRKVARAAERAQRTHLLLRYRELLVARSPNQTVRAPEVPPAEDAAEYRHRLVKLFREPAPAIPASKFLLTP